MGLGMVRGERGRGGEWCGYGFRNGKGSGVGLRNCKGEGWCEVWVWEW